jgi:hypothetical protein
MVRNNMVELTDNELELAAGGQRARGRGNAYGRGTARVFGYRDTRAFGRGNSESSARARGPFMATASVAGGGYGWAYAGPNYAESVGEGWYDANAFGGG